MSVDHPVLHVGRRFRVDDRTRQLEWLATYSLSTPISRDDDGWPRASAMPLIVRPNEQGRQRLYGHLDRRNPQAEHLERALRRVWRSTQRASSARTAISKSGRSSPIGLLRAIMTRVERSPRCAGNLTRLAAPDTCARSVDRCAVSKVRDVGFLSPLCSHAEHSPAAPAA